MRTGRRTTLRARALIHCALAARRRPVQGEAGGISGEYLAASGGTQD
jgi:hypothetical protein